MDFDIDTVFAQSPLLPISFVSICFFLDSWAFFVFLLLFFWWFRYIIFCSILYLEHQNLIQGCSFSVEAHRQLCGAQSFLVNGFESPTAIFFLHGAHQFCSAASRGMLAFQMSLLWSWWNFIALWACTHFNSNIMCSLSSSCYSRIFFFQYIFVRRRTKFPVGFESWKFLDVLKETIRLQPPHLCRLVSQQLVLAHPRTRHHPSQHMAALVLVSFTYDSRAWRCHQS